MAAPIQTLVIQLDTQQIKKLIDEMRIEFARVVRSIPVVISDDGSEWADVTDMRRLCESWEKSV